MTGHLKGNLAESSACCSHHSWWHGSLVNAARKQFPLPGHKKHYAPDMPFHVRHVKLVIEVDPTKASLAGDCHTTIEPVGKPVSEVFFETDELEVSKASIAGAADSLTFEKVERGYNVHLGKQVNPGETVEIALSYKVLDPKAGIYFTGPDNSYQEPYQVWTQGQDEDSKYWYPVAGADFPNHKATTEVIVTVPKRFTALSNGKLMSDTVDEEKGLRTFHWLLDKPHVSYLVALVIGVFEKLEKQYMDTPVQLFCDPEMLPQAKQYFEDTEKLVALYSRLYGVEYPWPGKYAQVMVRRYVFGGMENTTITVMTDRILADSTTRDEYRKFELRLNAHELNHHWNGDFVTCRDWSHGHLNEGGATYGEVEAIEHFYGKKERDYYVKGLADVYFAEDRGRYRRPIVSPFYNEPIDLFDRHLYQKAGLVRHMLRYLLGDEGYYKSVKTYLTEHAYGSVETIDWIKAIEKATGRNLRKFFDQWVYGAGFPEYTVGYTWDERNKVATVKVTQDQKLENQTGLFSMPIVFSFTLADGTTKNFTLDVEEKENSFHFSLDSKPVMFRFDPENWILKTVALNVPKAMLMHQLHNDPAVTGRVFAAQALAKLGGTDVAENLECAAMSAFHWGASVEATRGLAALGTSNAKEALKRLAAHSVPQVRRAAVVGLGSFKDEAVAELLAGIVSGDSEKSVFVKADAAAALGRTKSPKAFDVLKDALAVESWNQTIRVGVLNGLAELGDERGIELAADFSGAAKPFYSRPAAIAALGKLGSSSPKAVEHLHNLADTEDAQQFTLFMALVGAMGESKSAQSVPVLHKLKSAAGDGRVKRIIAETLEHIAKPTDAGKANEELKAQVERLAGQVRDLTDKLNAHSTSEVSHSHEHATPRKRKPRQKRAS